MFCRFNKCLSIGMKPNWVLSDEQCTIRFRKVRQEKVNEKELDIEEEVLTVKKEPSAVEKSKFKNSLRLSKENLYVINFLLIIIINRSISFYVQICKLYNMLYCYC